MKKKITSLGIIFYFLFFSGVSLFAEGTIEKLFPPSVDTAAKSVTPPMSEQAASGYWITMPSENAIIIIGVSNLLVKTDDEITAAKEDAARKAAMYHGMSGTVESVQSSGANFFDYIADSIVELDYDSDHAKYIDLLTFDPKLDVVKTDNTVFVRFKYAVPATPVNFTASVNDKGRPNWTYSRDLPHIDGYKTAVGFARNQVRLKDAIRKSTEAAAARMIEGASTQIISTDKSTSGTGSSSLLQTRSTGTLTNFHIIEFWIDPETGYVYTLAIAKQGN